MQQQVQQCRSCGAAMEQAHASGLCRDCREARIAAAHAQLARMQRGGLAGMGAGAGVIAFAGWWVKAGGGIAAFWAAGAGGLLFFGGGFAWLVGWGVRAWHRDAARQSSRGDDERR